MHPRHRVTSLASTTSSTTMHHYSSRSYRKKRPKLITFGVNDRFAADGTIDCPLDTIKSRSFYAPLRAAIILLYSLPHYGPKALMALDDERNRAVCCSKNAERELWVNHVEYSPEKRIYITTEKHGDPPRIKHVGRISRTRSSTYDRY